MSRTPDSTIAIAQLPMYLSQAGHYDKLLNLLSEEHLERLIETNQSLALVNQQAQLGVNAAYEMSRNDYLVQFCIQSSAIRNLDGLGVMRSEIEALMALGETESARLLAQSAMLDQDRLHALAIIGRIQKEKGRDIDSESLSQIRQL